MNDKNDTTDVERPHVVDGIKEYDNPLPTWWIGLFIFTIIFGIAYLYYFHLGSGQSLTAKLNEEMVIEKNTKLAATQDSMQTKEASQDLDGEFATLVQDGAVVAAGKAHYDSFCSPCHLADLGGQIGPNLVDDHWLYGCSPSDIIKTIRDGQPAKGMAAWGPILGNQKIKEVTAYIISKKGSQPATAKAPQGELCTWTP